MSKDQSKVEVNTPPPSVSRKQANYALTILFIVFVFNFIDRQILAILLEPIKKDLQVSDTAMGFLTGITFAVFYTFCGLPIARWADKGNRGTIISIGLFYMEPDDSAFGNGNKFHSACSRSCRRWCW